ncbi:MAG: YozE family protein [Candidatus Sphingomonas phytovorans]|nr:YozE family protein [Sphingomonas sp.]WEK00635.1 MAG: YozE family protein [Sphingomonas sp.]
MLTAQAARYEKKAQPLGRWLLGQAGRDDAIGDLARAAKADRGFPKDGDYEAISRRLNQLQADGDTHEALEQADIEAVAY